MGSARTCGYISGIESLEMAVLGLLEDPSLPPGVLGGVDAELVDEGALLPLVEDVDVEDFGLVVSSVVDGLFAGDRGSFSSARPFSSGRTSGSEDSGAPSLPSPLSATDTDGAMSSPVFDLSLPLSFSRIVDAFSLPF